MYLFCYLQKKFVIKLSIKDFQKGCVEKLKINIIHTLHKLHKLKNSKQTERERLNLKSQMSISMSLLLLGRLKNYAFEN